MASSVDEDDHDYPSRPRWMLIAVAGVLVAAGVGIGLGIGLGGKASAPTGPEGVPLQNVPDLASADTTVNGKTVDGFITCRPVMDQNDEGYHIHTHLDIFVNGAQERIPAGAGIVAPRDSLQLPGGTFLDSGANSCLYWLHVHADDGIIHVEAPQKMSFTLGEFFDVWGQPLGATQVAKAQGPVVIFVNGKRIDGNPRDIPLLDHEDVQLDVGTPVVAFKPLKFTVTGLCANRCGGPPTT